MEKIYPMHQISRTKTHSGLELRQRRLKLRRDQLKRLVFDIKLLVGTAENINILLSCEGNE